MTPNDTTMVPIGHLAERFNLRPSAIHFYEKMGLLQPARRCQAGHRLYDEQDIRRLELIVASRELGCTLAEIREVVGLNDNLNETPPTTTLQAYQGLLRRKRQALRRLERVLAGPGGTQPKNR
ncbi:MerR family transcriptional regulator [Xylella fastidiosa]|uniref:MerR family transcriptional regulator n=1 Tax=Xylella fastidiosa TaxID=2371 RepID=A0ABD7BX16_XYLFS|nr:MerR family transcriptional regulator [Xylella fastidiosa]QPB72559.1 MerR family transcriptional regulator [Xylella fastidiosa]